MITIARCPTLDRALGIKMQLESIGIEVFIPDETAAGVSPHHFFTAPGVRVQVADDRAEEAREFLGRSNNEEKL